MASTVLPNGIIIPEKFSRDWYADLYHNWQELDNLLGGGTPKDGTLTIQKNGDTVGTFSANQATDETVNITVPDVNDATLTIQKNGTTVDSFTANSSTDKTVNITVPTTTSELTNDSGFITSDDTKIPLAGSNAISGSLIPATTDAYDLGGPSYQYNNAYIKSLTINGVACGDILTHNASEFVPCSGGAVITGTAFSKNVDNSEFRINGGSDWNKGGSVTVYGKDRTDENGKVVLHAANGNNETHFSFYPNGYVALGPNFSFNTNVTFQIGSSAGLYTLIRYDGMVWSNSNYIYPASNLIMGLGSTGNKWKTFNGINPGALSLPGTFVNVDTTNWVLDGSDVNGFTPTSDGWLGIQATDTVYDQMHYIFVGRTGGGSAYYQQNITSPINALWDGEYHGCVFIPVVKGISYHIRCICNLVVATFYPCQGNA